jgi:hypothetical protein
MDALSWHLNRYDRVLARKQAEGVGLSRHQWEWFISSGRWQRLTAGVALAQTGDANEEQLLRAAASRAGSDARLSGLAGLRVHGFTGGTLTGIDVVIPKTRVVTPFQIGTLPVVPHRITVPAAWATQRRSIEVLSVSACLLHAAAWAGKDRDAEWPVAAAVQQHLTAVPVLRAALAELKRHPRRGLLHQVFDDVEHGAHAGTELAFLAFCRRHGLPLPDSLQLKVRANGTKYLDARYAAQRVTIELDGAHHREVRQWDADALRSLGVIAATGDRLVRITGGNLRHDSDALAVALRLLLL